MKGLHLFVTPEVVQVIRGENVSQPAPELSPFDAWEKRIVISFIVVIPLMFQRLRESFHFLKFKKKKKAETKRVQICVSLGHEPPIKNSIYILCVCEPMSS